jgi:hypothetical protein
VRPFTAGDEHDRRTLRHRSAGRNPRSLSFYSLRHSFVSALANAGVATVPDFDERG